MNSNQEMFEMVREYCREQMPAGPYSLWIKDIVCEDFNHSGAVLSVPTDFRKQIIEAKYITFLKNSFEAVVGFEVDIKIISDEEKKPVQNNSNNTTTTTTTATTTTTTTTTEPEHDSMSDISLSFPSGEDAYTFSSFVVGSSNKFAHAASLAVAINPASSYNPLFIYGNSGLGKTHLLNAICAEVLHNNPNFKILYVKGEDFTNELISAIQNKRTDLFHDKYRQADMLLVDDIQFISGKIQTQEEFFHTFNSLYESNKQIVLASDRPPKEIKTLEDRLRSRFESGLLADVQPPDYETRVAILRRKAEMLNFDLPQDVADYIANRIKNNIRQLEGSVKKINAYQSLTKTAPSISVAQTVIRDILNDAPPISVTVDRIINEVSRYFEVSSKEIRSTDRTAAVSAARQASMYIIREVTNSSMSAIGAEFSDRDHSTVVYTINQAKKVMKKNPHFKNTVEDIIKNIKEN